MEEILAIDVVIDGAADVTGADGNACMIAFHGESNCKNFKGTILPGGVDTQKQLKDEPRSLSARYILEGTDYTGEHCRIFIENNGVFQQDGSIKTKPIILTDSKALSWMAHADITGTITGTENGVRIAFWAEKEDRASADL